MVVYIIVSMMHAHTNTKLHPVHNFTLIFNIHLTNILVSSSWLFTLFDGVVSVVMSNESYDSLQHAKFCVPN